MPANPGALTAAYLRRPSTKWHAERDVRRAQPLSDERRHVRILTTGDVNLADDANTVGG